MSIQPCMRCPWLTTTSFSAAMMLSKIAMNRRACFEHATSSSTDMAGLSFVFLHCSNALLEHISDKSVMCFCSLLSSGDSKNYPPLFYKRIQNFMDTVTNILASISHNDWNLASVEPAHLLAGYFTQIKQCETSNLYILSHEYTLCFWTAASTMLLGLLADRMDLRWSADPIRSVGCRLSCRVDATNPQSILKIRGSSANIIYLLIG
jgi:hypothetical protein